MLTAFGDLIKKNPENQVWGPGHGNVFYDEGTDAYIFVYLEYGDGGTTRQVYANRMEFNEDGTISQFEPTTGPKTIQYTETEETLIK